MLLASGTPAPAQGALLSRDIADVVASPRSDAQLPLDISLSADESSAPLVRWLDLATQLLGHQLLAVANAEDR